MNLQNSTTALMAHKIPYTHYWKIHDVPTPQQIALVLKDCEKIQECTKGIKIQFGFEDDDPPTFDEKMIRFNGCTLQTSHQSLLIQFEKTQQQFYESVKTARKPYDKVVSMVLLSCVSRIKSFELRSDGVKNDWEPIIKDYKKFVGTLDQQNQYIKFLLRQTKPQDEQFF